MKELPFHADIAKDTVDPVEIFILDNEPNAPYDNVWRKQLLAAVNWSEDQIIANLQRKAIAFNRAGFSNSELIVKDLIEDVKLIFAHERASTAKPGN